MTAIRQRVLFALVLSLMFTGCSRHKVATAPLPAAPPPSSSETGNASSATSSVRQPPARNKQDDEPDKEADALNVPLDAKPLFVETGIASWYGPPYNNRRGSDGKIYNMNAMTAAHRTLPLGSIVRVTNLKTGHWAIVRITDRGPFIEGRILDLSLAAAKKTDVVRAGLARVRIDVLGTPTAMESGGRWAVQIGGFDQHETAVKLADQISRRYQSAKVLSFSSPVGDWWVRVRVLHDDRGRAQEIAKDTKFDQGKIFLVRLD
jgi:rare lipoprotein A